jgi:hypothetical protein
MNGLADYHNIFTQNNVICYSQNENVTNQSTIKQDGGQFDLDSCFGYKL